MREVMLFFYDHGHLIALVWICLVVGFSILFRLRKGLSLKPQGEILYHERFASGRSDRNWLTRIAGASKCLLVTVTDSELLVRPWFPFNLSFLPEIYDLEHRIPISKISGIRERQGLFGSEIVDVDFPSSSGGTRRFSLQLVGTAAFLKALRKNLRAPD